MTKLVDSPYSVSVKRIKSEAEVAEEDRAKHIDKIREFVDYLLPRIKAAMAETPSDEDKTAVELNLSSSSLASVPRLISMLETELGRHDLYASGNWIPGGANKRIRLIVYHDLQGYNVRDLDDDK